jgi:hypothetical protein
VFSAEGGPLEILAGRYSDGPNLELILKAHSGDYCAVDRIGRASFVLRAPALTLALTVQPDVIAGLARKPGFRGRGLLARFCYAVPRSRVGSRAADSAPIPSDVRAEYARAITRLLELQHAEARDDELVARVIKLDRAARKILMDAKAALEPRLAPGGDLDAITDWASKLTGTMARVALLLHLGDAARDPTTAVAAEVDGETMIRALRIGDYLTGHALAAFAAMGADPAIEDARYVLAWLRRTQRTTLSRRDVQRAMPTKFPKAENVEPALNVLLDRGYLRSCADPRHREGRGPGRPAGAEYDVHPDVRQI